MLLSRKELKVFLTFWFVYTMFAGGVGWNENSTLDLTKVMVDEHALKINSLSNNTNDVIYSKGNYYADKVPGLPVLAVPVYFVYKHAFGTVEFPRGLEFTNFSKSYLLLIFLCVMFITAPAGALTVVLVYRMSRYFTKKELHKNIAVAAFGLGTLMLPASSHFLPHAPAVFFVFLSFCLIFISRREKKDYILAAGLAGGAAVLVEYRVIAMLMPMLLFLLLTSKPKNALKFSVGLILCLALMQVYASFTYGRMFEAYALPNPRWNITDYTLNANPNDALSAIRACGLFVVSARQKGTVDGCDKVLPSQYYDSCCKHAEAFLKDDAVLCPQVKNAPLRVDCYLRNIIGVPYRMAFSVAYTINSMKAYLLNIAVRVLFYPDSGLFLLYPVLMLSVLGMPAFFRKFREEAFMALGVMAAWFIFYLLTHLNMLVWESTFVWPRYFTPLMPFLALPLICAVTRFRLKVVLFFTILSVSLSFVYLPGSPPSDYVVSTSPFTLSEEFYERLDSWKPLSSTNNLLGYYIPAFLKDGPRSLLIEQIISVQLPPFLNVAIVLLFLLFVWKNPIRAARRIILQKKISHKKEQ